MRDPSEVGGWEVSVEFNSSQSLRMARSDAPVAMWSGRAGQIAVRIAGAWEFQVPKVGWLCFIADEAVLSVYKAAGWSAGVAI